MMPYFKEYLKSAYRDSLENLVKGAVTGAVCGGLADVLVSNNLLNNNLCFKMEYIQSFYGLGALYGTEAGVVVALFTYPIFKMSANCLNNYLFSRWRPLEDIEIPQRNGIMLS